MDSSVFEIDADSGSDFGGAAKAKAKPTKTAKKPAATTKKTAAAPKAKAAAKTTTKSTVPKKRSKKEADDEDGAGDGGNDAFDDESLLAATPPKKAKVSKPAKTVKSSHAKPLADIVNAAMAKDGDSPQAPRAGDKNVSEQYQRLTQLEHIIRRPDTYIGSVEYTQEKMWVYSTVNDAMEYRIISFVPGIFKIFDEILVNAADNKQNDKKQDQIKVVIDRENGRISVWNNGRGIPIEMHAKEKMYIPEMIFGNLLTGSNYNDEEKKVTGGRNGYGAKLANIFSTRFTVETASKRNKKKYRQTWTKNMSVMSPPVIEDQKDEDWTKVTFEPDFAKFGMTGIDDDLEALFKRRVYDLAGTLRDCTVYLNGTRLPAQNFKKYIEMYTKGIKNERGEEAQNDNNDILVDKPDPRWEIGFAVSDGSFQQVSFVNSVATTSGGTHVNYIADQIVTKLLEVIKKRNKGGAQLKPHQIRNHIFIFVNALIVNPAFTSQTKEQLTTKASQFGSTCTISDSFMKKIAATEVVANILSFAQQKADQILKKSDGNKRSRMHNPKLVDANNAGTRNGHLCTLILTEGDSAKGLAMAGRSVVGPDLFGVFPLRGKLLNVRDASIDQISKNVEIQNIKTFLGLQHKKVYTDTKDLRYGHLMIMTDQDHDGSHIKGLLINFLQVQFPSLLKIPEFLVEFITPIVKTWKGDPKHPTQSRTFFTLPEYEAWKEAHKHELKSWDHKYYKGLGTSSAQDAEVYFNDLDKHHKEFDTMKEEEAQLIELAFSKKKADERKEWLRQFKPGTFLDHTAKKITYTDFINKELILFSMADNIRSIPSVIDGLKPGQRKVLYTCFRRNLKKDMKVVELAGLVSGLTAYQHGETSLQQTIVTLAQTFVGSNNVNCLEPSGNFGSRLQGGSDCASARYIYTRLTPFARKLFHQADEPLLTYNQDDGKAIEPELYAPIVPMILVNGADGIGTGWSSSIPNYNPEEIVENLKRRMAGEDWLPMKPWFRDFKGAVTEIGPDRFKFSGIVKQVSDSEVEITELPVRMWTQDFKDKLEEILKAEKVPSFIKDYKDYNTHENVNFIIQMDDKQMKSAVEEGLEERFKLSKTMATSNLVAFDPEGRITKYNSIQDIMEEFYRWRLQMYAKRKEWLLSDMNKTLKKLTNQARFVQMIIDGKLVISKKKKAVLIAELQKLGFDPFSKAQDAADKQADPFAAEEEEDADEATVTDASSYDYLLGMALWSLTQERVERLLRQIGEKEEEITALTKKSKEDLWRADLDDFIAEWKFQLEDEKNRMKNIRKGRRVSKKFATTIGKPVRKVKGLGDADNDDDYEDKKPKKAPAKSNPLTAAAKAKQTALAVAAGKVKLVSPPKTSSVHNYRKLSQTPPKVYTDGPSDELDSGSQSASLSGTQQGKTADKEKKKAPLKQTKLALKAESGVDDSQDEVMPKASSRTARAVASKPKSYTFDVDSDSDNGDALLADLGDMVRGLSKPNRDSSDDTNSRPLFSASGSRPSSSNGFKLPAKSEKKPATGDFLPSDDDTNFEALAPRPQQASRQSILVTNKEKPVLELNNGSDSDPVVAPTTKSKAAPAKKAVRAKKTAEADGNESKPAKKTAAVKKAAAAPAKKAKNTTTSLDQSPVAKAYAKRLVKKKIVDPDSDEDDDDLMDVDAAPPTKAKNDLLDDILDSDDDDDELQAPPVTKQKATAAARPARRAATTKKETVKRL
ncbi:hypothetical protein DV735_g3616, partial [Chaetothyriales sp. CBS 134920]